MPEIIFRLAIDENVMGLPRMAFVLIFGCVGVLFVACCALLVTCCSNRRKGKKYYSFSLLPQKPEQRKLFEDDDDVDETELFRTPIKGNFIISKNLKFYIKFEMQSFCCQKQVLSLIFLLWSFAKKK